MSLRNHVAGVDPSLIGEELPFIEEQDRPAIAELLGDDGYYKDMSEDDYHNNPRYSGSFFKSILLSGHPHNAWYKRWHAKQKTKDCFERGKWLHSMILEGVGPEIIFDSFAVSSKAKKSALAEKLAKHDLVLPDEFTRSDQVQPWVDEKFKEKGLTYYTKSGYEKLKALESQVRENPTICEAIEGGEPEQTVFFKLEDHGVEDFNFGPIPMKARFDNLKRGPRIDELKSWTGRHGVWNAKEFQNEIAYRHYDLSGYLYWLAHKLVFGTEPEFYFLVMNTEAPNQTFYLPAGESVLESGKEKLVGAVRSWLSSLERGDYNQFAPELDELNVPVRNFAEVL